MADPQTTRIYTLTKIDAAVHHLDWAMRLVVDHGAFDVALTLAGAAEEVLGKAFPGEAVAKSMIRRLQEVTGLPEKTIVSAHLNKVRNWLKHNDPNELQILEVELETEAVCMIVRGFSELDSR